MTDWIGWGHWFATVYMTGLIWFVQCVHYPLMSRVPANEYVAFQRAHMARTSWVVGPMMLIEAFTAAALMYTHPDVLSFRLVSINFVLLLLIWISTAIWQVPCHGKLLEGFNEAAHRKLVRTNWVRTVLWSVRAVGISFYMIPREAVGL